MTDVKKRLQICMKCDCFRSAVNDKVTCTKKIDYPIDLGTGACPMHKWDEKAAEAVVCNSKEVKGKSPAQKVQASTKIDEGKLYNVDWKVLHLKGLYVGRSAFLVLGGPSFADLDHDKLRQPGILTMGANNSPRTFRPNLWTYVDPPCKWIRSTWLDPTIMKFGCRRDRDKPIFDSDKWEAAGKTVRECPNVFYYERNADRFDPSQYLHQSTFWWGQGGNTTDEFGQKGGRSVMLLAIRLLHYLGCHRVFLLGCDFKMDAEHFYHFDQKRTKGSIRGNSATYRKMNKWFAELRPYFDAEGFKVFNCNPDSGLKAFQYIPYDTAIQLALDEWGNINISTERTAGLYEMEKLVGENGDRKQADGKGSYTARASGKARIRSSVTGKLYKAIAHAEKKVTCTAKGEAKTIIGSRVNAEVNARMKAFYAATEQAEELAKEKAMEKAKQMMADAEKVVAA